MIIRVLEKGLPSAGLYAGPAAWIVSTQANYSLVPWVCTHGLQLVPLLALVLVVVSLFGGFLSWQAWRNAGSSADLEIGGQPRSSVALIGMGMAVLFATVIVLQGAAGFVLDGCER